MDEWERLIHDEDVTVESGGPNVVELVLDPGTYELRMAKVGFGSEVNGEDESYLTVVDGPENVSEGESTEMTLEVRDRFNNPVSNVQVNATDDGDGTLTPDNDTIGSARRVTFTHTAGDDEGGSAAHLDTSFRVDPNVSPINTSQPENVSRTIRIASSSDSGSGGGGPDGAAFIISNFQSPSSSEQGDTIIVNATVTNTGSVKGTQTVEYTFDGTVENSSSVTLDPGTSTTVEFVPTVPKSIPTGDYSQAIDSADDSESVNIAVMSAPESPSIDQFAVSDDSNNNHAKYNVNWEVFDSENDIVEVQLNSSTVLMERSMTDSGTRTKVLEALLGNPY